MTYAATQFSTIKHLRYQRVADDWLSVVVDCAGTLMHQGLKQPSRETLLGWNAFLPGGVKFALSGESRVCLRTERRWTEEHATTEAAAEVTAGFVEAQRLWKHDAVTHPVAPLPLANAIPEQLIQTCVGSGWGVNLRTDKTLVVDLDVGRGHWQAQVFSLSPNETLALVELAPIDAVSTASREALAHMLLLASGAVRWVRPALRMIGERCVAVFEVFLPSAPTAADFGDALAGLSIACRCCAEEAQALLDESAAADYLQIMTALTVPNRNR